MDTKERPAKTIGGCGWSTIAAGEPFGYIVVQKVGRTGVFYQSGVIGMA